MAQGSRGAQVGGIPENVFPIIRPANPQTLNFTGTASQSQTFQPQVTIGQLFATEDCFIKFGTNPTATSSDIFIPAGFVLFYNIFGGEKLSVIQKDTAGTLYLLEGEVG